MASLIGGLARPAAKLITPYVAPGMSLFGGLLDRSSMDAQMAAMGSVSTLYAVISAVAEAAAQQEWMVERVTSDARRQYNPGPERRTQIARHPALDLWNKPNPFYSRHDLVETSTQHLKLTGECYWIVVTDPRVPTLPLELWPVRPDRMTPVPHPTDFLSGWVYTAPGGERVPLDVSQVIQIRLPNPMDPYRGLGPVQALLADLDSVRYSAEWNRRFFLNDATPGGIIEFDEPLGDDQWDKFKTRWLEQHRGVAAAHKVAFLEKAHWKDRQFTMRDMQFVELRNVSRDVIREAFRVHKAILGQSDDVNRANADAADYQLARWNVDPVLSRFRGALNTRLMPMYGDPANAEFCYSSPVPEDEAAEMAELTARTGAYATLIGAGVNPEDAAMVACLPPMRHVQAAPVPAIAPGTEVPA